MKVIIAGSRSIADYDLLVKVINQLNWKITEIVSGGAYGVDKLGIRYAKDNNIECKMFLPDWDTHGKKAGILRNKSMVEYADGLIALWDGESKGTRFTIEYAKQNKLIVHVHNALLEKVKQNLKESKAREQPCPQEFEESFKKHRFELFARSENDK